MIIMIMIIIIFLSCRLVMTSELQIGSPDQCSENDDYIVSK